MKVSHIQLTPLSVVSSSSASSSDVWLLTIKDDGSWNHMALVIIIRESRARAQVSLWTLVKKDFFGRIQIDTQICWNM